MKIRKINIKNFRGIKELDWCLPQQDIFCLIGKGDSCKSTIMEAIRFTFYPHWNLALNDADFFHNNVKDSIVIEVTIGDLIAEFYSLNKYGNHLRGWSKESLQLTDEPDDHLEAVLTIRLTVKEDLQPLWTVFTDRTPDGVDFKPADRSKVNACLIGAHSDRQLSWAPGTALTNLTDKQSVKEILVSAARNARTLIDTNRASTLKNLDEAAGKSEQIARRFGVPVNDTYKAHLDLTSVNLSSGGFTLHDGSVPLRLLGLGSRRMLICGIQQLNLEEGHITLFDELESGLEPHRIARLIKCIREDMRGQYFLTTHSPTVLRELTIKELHIVHNYGGNLEIVAAAKPGIEALGIQGKIRSSAEAFLAKKIVVCEGATEVGFLRGLDDYKVSTGKDPYSFHGVALIDAGGASKVKNLAQAFKSLGYDVAVLADGDAPNDFSNADQDELTSFCIPVHVWSDKLSLEERAFQDLPWVSVIESLKLAKNELGFPVVEQVKSIFQSQLDEDVELWPDNYALRTAIGKTAKSKNISWFKDITRGDLWFKVISPAFNESEFAGKNLAVELEKLWAWVEDV